MRKPFLIALPLLLLLAGCGGGENNNARTSTPTPAATEAEASRAHDLEGYSQGVIDYYGEPHEHAGDTSGNVEAEYHQPPKPAKAGMGETITLTGTNIGVRMEVTVTGVERVADDLVAVKLRMNNTGITVYEAPLEHATVTYPGGEPQGVALDASAECSNGFDEVLRIDTARRRTGCLLFPADGDAVPERFQLALEVVPVEAGGIWNLSAR
jgi:hypothetical protein